MLDFRSSIAAKLVLSYGLLALFTVATISTVFYFGTIGVIDHNVDNDIRGQGARLAPRLQSEGVDSLAADVTRQLYDGIDSDREIYLVIAADGRRLAGNLTAWSSSVPLSRIVNADVVRNGIPTRARLLAYPLPGGGFYVIGDDLRELGAMQSLVWRALAVGAVLAVVMTIVGAFLFRRQISGRISDIRTTARSIAAGDLSQRIPTVSKDEFGLLNQDINDMLDRIENLMSSVRNVSNAIAHDLRTPLTRMRNKLDLAIRRADTVDAYRATSMAAIADIDDIIRLFEGLLQIAEAEAGVGTSGFASLDLGVIAADIAEMYENTADELAIRVTLDTSRAKVRGDRNLVATAIASLLENAIKYGSDGGRIDISVSSQGSHATISVRDYGAGIPAPELHRVTERFYRLDKSRSAPGNGLGLSIVSAIAKLHRGTLDLGDAAPGLCATISLPLIGVDDVVAPR